jgi:DNA-binding CsgD family transcriptional regulator
MSRKEFTVPGLESLRVRVLTGRETEVLHLVRQGYPTNRIAAACRLSPYTVRDYIVRLKEAVGVASRGELQAWAWLNPGAVECGVIPVKKIPLSGGGGGCE